MPPHWLLLSLLLVEPDAGAGSAPPQAPPQAPPEFRACLAGLRPQLVDEGIKADTLDGHLATVVPDPSVLDLLDAQPEFTTAIWDYLAGLVDDERVADGRAMLREHADVLDRIEQAYGVDRYTVLAIWGVETDYGRTLGSRPLLASLATLSCAGRRQAFFRDELAQALRIVQSGDIAAGELVGSWAGAFGQTQFMPSTFQRVAVDFDGDGRRDLMGSVADALASTAHYLDRAGWRSGRPWGFEVRLPEGFDVTVSGRGERRPLAYWTGRGIRRIDGADFELPGTTPAALLLPAGQDGPAILVLRNFDAIYRYNAAESYALAIALLSDRLRGEPPLRTPWPTDDPGLSRQQRRELQTLLLARGHPIGEVDGIIGPRTRRAILREQQRLQLEPTGRASRSILQALRAESPRAPGAAPGYPRRSP